MELETPLKSHSKRAPTARRDRADGGDDQQLQPLEVFCRLRPLDDCDTQVCLAVSGDDVVKLPLSAAAAEHAHQPASVREYKFTRVFDGGTGQTAVFDCVALPLVADVLKAKSALLFTYGVTGSGKTFTMTGQRNDVGILQRCIDAVFNSVRRCQAPRGVVTYEGNNGFAVHSFADALDRQRRNGSPAKIPKTPGGFRAVAAVPEEDQVRIQDATFLDLEATTLIAVFVSFVENHEASLFDLLDDTYVDPIKRNFPVKKLCDVPTSEHAYIKDLTELEVRSAQEAMDVLNLGQKRRTVAETVLNRESSRGHAVFTLKCVHTPLANVDRPKADRDAYVVSQLSLVDLAGSERAARSGTEGKLRREANHINQSLSTLRACLDNMRDNQMRGANKPVPFREAKITQLFKGFFNGRGRVRVILCINPSIADYDENIHALRFAEAAQDVVTAKHDGFKFDLDAFKENLPADPVEVASASVEIAPAFDFPITVDMRAPLFRMHGTRESPSVFDFDPADMFADLHSSKWDYIKEELKNRAQVRTTRAQMAAESLRQAQAKGVRMVKELGGARGQLTEIKDSDNDNRKEVNRLSHLLSATQSERERLRITTGIQKRAQIGLINQVKAKEAAVEAERRKAQRVEHLTKTIADSIVQRSRAKFEMMAAETNADELRKLTRRLSQIHTLSANNRGGLTSSADSDTASASESDAPRHAGGRIGELQRQLMGTDPTADKDGKQKSKTERFRRRRSKSLGGFPKVSVTMNLWEAAVGNRFAETSTPKNGKS